MRTRQQDTGQSHTITVTGKVTAGGTNFQMGSDNGVVWIGTDNSGGLVTVRAPIGMVVISASASADSASGWTVRIDNVAAPSVGLNTFRIVLTNSANVLTNDIVHFTMTLLDRRS